MSSYFFLLLICNFRKMKDFSGNYFVYNDHVLPCSDFDPELFQTGASVYEVVRIINKVPLFLEEHLTRFKNTARIKGCKLWLSEKQIAEELYKLINANTIVCGNIKLVFTYASNATQKSKCSLAYFVEHRYPTKAEYELGVRTVSITAERPNPNAKVAFRELREQANEIIKHQNVYEVILVDNKGFITEGSRSNIFFVQGKKVFTPPMEQVLPGITREKVLKICKNLNIHTYEEPIKFKFSNQFDSAFLTGTSPMVLPIKSIDNYEFEATNKTTSTIRFSYEKLVEEATNSDNKNY